MGWMKTNYVFDNRSAILTIGRHAMRRSKHGGDLQEFMLQADAEGKLDILERLAVALVASYRPELTGCVLYFVNFDWSTQSWEFGVSHGSLPPVSLGNCLPKSLLDSRESELGTVAGTGEKVVVSADSPAESSADWFRRVMSQPSN